MPVATESTQEYRDLRELLDTGSSGGGAGTVEEAERKQKLLVFGGAAAVVLLVIVGLVAFPKDDDKGGGSKAAAEGSGESADDASTKEESAPPTTVPPLAAPEGTRAVPYQVLSTKVLAGLKQGDKVDFYNGPNLVAANILVLGIGPEEEGFGGFKLQVLTIAAPEAAVAPLLDVKPGDRSMAQASGEPAPAPAPDPAAPPADPAAPPA